MTSFTSRYGDPAADHNGAHLWAHRRHGATVIAVRGRVDADNVARVTEYATRVIASDSDVVLELSEVTTFTPEALGLLTAVDERCAAAAVTWALVPGPAVAECLANRAEWAGLAILESVAEAEHRFDEAIQRRGHFLVPLLHRTA